MQSNSTTGCSRGLTGFKGNGSKRLLGNRSFECLHLLQPSWRGGVECFLEVAEKGNESMMLCITPVGLGFTLSPWQLLQIICCFNKQNDKINSPSLMPHCCVLWWDVTQTGHIINRWMFDTRLRKERKKQLRCVSRYLQCVGSVLKSAKYFSRPSKLWNVYLQGYLHHTAHSPEDESSAGYVQYIWGGLWISSWRRGAKKTAEPSRLYWFSVTLFHNSRRYLLKETVNLTHPPQ